MRSRRDTVPYLASLPMTPRRLLQRAREVYIDAVKLQVYVQGGMPSGPQRSGSSTE